MRLIFAILLLQVAALFPSSVSAADERTYKVYHRIGGGDFAERGSVVLSAGEENGEDDNASAASSDATLTATATNAADCIVPTAVDEMVSNGSMYTVKVVDEQTGQSAAASVPGCDVRRANFREEIGLTLSQTGSLVSVTYTPLVSPLAPSCHSLQPLLASDEEQVPEFKTTITYETCKPAMTVPLVLPKVKAPPGLKLYPRKKAAPGEDGAAGGSGGGGAAFEDEEKAQNQSFLMKYWYIILPIIILQFVGSPEPPPEEGGQGGGGGARAAGGAAVAAAGAGASAPRQRRGKRD